MTRIRSLREEDLPQVVPLYRTHLARPNVADPADLRESFDRIFLGGPLVDPDIPSLVFENRDGEILGFIGSLVHRMRFGQRSVRLATSSSLVVSPDARQVGAGGLLLRKYLAGPQDLTMTDTAGVATERMWKRLGGAMYNLGSITWLHLIHPVRAAAGLKLWHSGNHHRLRVARPLCRPLDAAYARFSGSDGGPSERLTEENLTPRLLIENLHLGARKAQLWPEYGPGTLNAVLSEIARSESNGQLVRKLVRDDVGKPMGWYVASLLPSDIYRVLGLAASSGNEARLLHHVLRNAQEMNAAAVAGRVEPWLLEVLPRRTMMFSRVRFLVHARDQAILDAVCSSKALITGLESDVWMPR